MHQFLNVFCQPVVPYYVLSHDTIYADVKTELSLVVLTSLL